jgi:mono/diheme cytochrome c family protein
MSVRGSRAIHWLLVIGLFGLVMDVRAQSTKPGSVFTPIPNPNAQQKRGEYLFLQRCSLCHVMKYGRAGARLPAVWMNLAGLFKDAPPDQENTVRQFILKGTPRMPGWQYTLQANQIDDLIAFLKTL